MDIVISVVVPVYNVEKYIRKCVNSIIEQTYRRIEIILVDDGSTDNCPQILDEYASGDKRIHVIHKENGGLVSARKAGVEVASGDYIVHVDGDDYIAATRMEHLVHCIERESSDVVIMAGDFRVIRGRPYKKEPITPYKNYLGAEICSQLISQFVDEDFAMNLNWGMCASAAKNEIAKKCQAQVDNRITYLEDFSCLILMLQLAEKVSVISECGYYYVFRENSITKQNDRTAVEKLKVMWDFVKSHTVQEYWNQAVRPLRKYCLAQLMYKAYGEFLTDEYSFLYPFQQVKEGSRIVLYGSGMFGTGMMRALRDSTRYTVEAWIDENTENQPLTGLCVQPVDVLRNIQYDYLVIALMRERVAQRVKELLLSEDVPAYKLVVIDRQLLEEQYLSKRIFD